jgi:hypothetical protein
MDDGQRVKKRSSYKPRASHDNAHVRVLAGFLPLSVTGGALLALRIRNNWGVLNLQRGSADDHDMTALSFAANMTFALLQVGGEQFGIEYKPAMEAASDAVYFVLQRGRPYSATDAEIDAISMGARLHDAQLDVCTVGIFAKAQKLEGVAMRTGRGVPTRKIQPADQRHQLEETEDQP